MPTFYILYICIHTCMYPPINEHYTAYTVQLCTMYTTQCIVYSSTEFFLSQCINHVVCIQFFNSFNTYLQCSLAMHCNAQWLAIGLTYLATERVNLRMQAEEWGSVRYAMIIGWMYGMWMYVKSIYPQHMFLIKLYTLCI